MSDGVEDILKDIHVLFAKSEPYGNSPDLIIVSKEKMFELLERLNEELGEVLDRYEATTLSRERARLDMEREKNNTIAAAKQASDDIHAASLLYTDNMINSINDIFDSAKYQIKHDMLEVMAKIEDQTEMLSRNREGVKNELAGMHDGGLYLELIEKLRKREEEKRITGEEKEEDLFEEVKPAAPKLDIRVNKPGENSGVTFSTKRSHKNNKKKPSAAAAPAEHEEGEPYSADEFDLDGEYFAWQEGQEEGAEEEKKPRKKGFFFRK